MLKLKVRSQSVHKRSNKILVYACLEDVFFFDPMYSSYSEGDNDEDYIKLKALYNKQSSKLADDPKDPEELANLALSKHSNSSASLSSTRSADCNDNH